MQATLSEPPTNGTRDVMATLEQSVRRSAESPPAVRCPGFHDFLDSARGVIHVGAHTGQERDLYGDLPVAWVEASPLVYQVLCEQTAGKPKQTAYQYLIADGKPYRFGLSNNAAQSSSIFDFAQHKAMWPGVGHVASTRLDSITLRDFIDWHHIDLDAFDTLVLDVQGAELLALQGAGDYLRRFRWVQAEAADFEAYHGGCQLRDIDEYMAAHGFLREQLHCCKAMEGVGSYYEAVWRNAAHDPTPEAIPDAAAVRPPWLNLGAGATTLPGFVNIDRKLGSEVYPLPHADGSVEEIVASHVLEHFSHREVSLVLLDWVRALAPGGRLRLAVPDFEELARLYLDGAPVHVQGFVMGGHTDANDHHGCIFDRESLTELMVQCGLERIGPWADDLHGCAAGPHSLNLVGFKPSSPVTKVEGVRACMSVPRFGPLMHPRCAEKAFFQLGIEGSSTSSCYWAQQISNKMEEAIEDPACRYVLTMDFDTVFCAGDVLELYRLLEACPEIDAVFPLQSKRGCNDALFAIPGKAPGAIRTAIAEADLLHRNLLPAASGHFGLTLFRADSLRRFPRPWMVPVPNAEGRWDGGHVDADIDFWRRFRAAGFKVCLAPKVVVGHLEEVVKWPGKDLKPVYQDTADYEETGIPAEVAR